MRKHELLIFCPGEEKKKISANFTAGEFKCKAKHAKNLQWFVSPLLLAIAQQIRTHINRSLEIESAFRTFAHNINEKGSPDSNHLYGLAIDCHAEGIPPLKLAAIGWHYGARRIGIGNGFAHIDIGPPHTGEHDFWTYGQSDAPSFEYFMQHVAQLG